MGAIELRRHGDLLLFTQLKYKVPEPKKLKATRLLFKGTNNEHYFSKGEVKMYVEGDKRFLRVTKKAVLSHSDPSPKTKHGDGELPVGDYWVEVKQEYDHLREESRNVID